MAKRLFIRTNEANEIIVWGEDMPAAIEIAANAIPSDWFQYSTGKYVWDGERLVAKIGWTPPVEPEPEPEPETPADPE
jgi:hypothetical protein